MNRLNLLLARLLTDPQARTHILGDLAERALLSTPRATREILGALARQEGQALRTPTGALFLLAVIVEFFALSGAVYNAPSILPAFRSSRLLIESAITLQFVALALSAGLLLPPRGKLALSAFPLLLLLSAGAILGPGIGYVLGDAASIALPFLIGLRLSSHPPRHLRLVLLLAALPGTLLLAASCFPLTLRSATALAFLVFFCWPLWLAPRQSPPPQTIHRIS